MVSKNRKGEDEKKEVYGAQWTVARNDILAAVTDAKQIKVAKNERVSVELRAGKQVFGFLGNIVFGIDLPTADTKAHVSWATTLADTPAGLIAADHKLFVTTQQGAILCFGDAQTPPEQSLAVKALPQESGSRGAKILREIGVKDGYVMVWGIGDGTLIRELLQSSEMHVIGIDPDAAFLYSFLSIFWVIIKRHI